MAIKAVLFDYGGVLTNAGRVGAVKDYLSQLYGQDLDWDKIVDLHENLKRGQITSQQFFNELNKRHGTTKNLNENQWLEISQDFFKKSEPVYNLADKLRGKGIKTAIMSNIYKMSADRLKQIGNYDNFDPIILSYEVGLAKPDQQMFKLTLDQLKLKPNEIIFVDDQTKNTIPAEKLGLHVVLANNEWQVVTDIKRIIKQENKLKL